MSISGTELREALAQSVSVSDDALVADLVDGRTITVPLAWFPRLARGTPAECAISAWRVSWRVADLARLRNRFVGGSSSESRPVERAHGFPYLPANLSVTPTVAFIGYPGAP